jgi:ketosteroid isomerase-like protein
MSANLDLVRSIYPAWGRGDYFGSTEWMHPEMEYVVADGPAPGRWTGVAATSEAWRDILDVWDDLCIEAEAFREIDGDRVLVLIAATGRGKTSGLAVEQMHATGAHVFSIRGSEVVRLVFYWERDHALADLGLKG